MQIKRLTTKAELHKFVSMADKIYEGDKFYVPYMRNDLYKTLIRLVLKEKTYTALAVEENGNYIARVLFTVDVSKQFKLNKCGYFSHFECVNDQKAADMLLGEMCKILKSEGVTYVEGTYFPFDQDNRRGILVKGFEYEPMILTSYNPQYYEKLLTGFGFKKDFDTVSYKMDYNRYDMNRIGNTVNKILKKYDLYISYADFSNLNRDIDDAHEIILEATNDIIFQQAPSRDDLLRIVDNWKNFLWEDFIYICRRRKDDKPVGFMMAVPNFYMVFRKMNGKSNFIALLKALYYKKHIHSVRVILQYVIPYYQGKGVNFALYQSFYDSCVRHKIDYIEGGTIMENNERSRLSVEGAGGKLNKIFRIYGREL